MSDTGLNYGMMMQKALRSVMHDALSQVAASGLPGEHHFYITYETSHPGVSMPDWLREKYPDLITVVIQFEYSGLEVADDGFSVTMSFSDRPASLYVPFDAVMTFVDPSVEFGLKFDSSGIDIEDETPEEEAAPAEKTSADVVSLDQFRKN